MRYFRLNGQPAVKLNTVSVIEMTNGEFQGIRSFADTPEGNKRAEKRFRQLVKEYEAGVNPSDEEDFENYLDDGVYDVYPGYTVYLSHSV